MRNLIIVLLLLIVMGCASSQEQKSPATKPAEITPRVTVQKSPYSVERPETQITEAHPSTTVDHAAAAAALEKLQAHQTEKPAGRVVRMPERSPKSEVTAKTSEKDEQPAPDVVLNFDNADIYEVLNVFSEILGINYLVDPRVKGTVTIRTAKKINRQQLMAIFHTILELNGVAAIKKDGFYQIVPVSELARKGEIVEPSGRLLRSLKLGRAIIAVIPLKYVSVLEMSRVVKPFLSEGGAIYEYPSLNILLLADTTQNVRRVYDIIESLDINAFDRVHFRLYSLENASVEDVGQEFQQAFDSTKLREAMGQSVIFNFTPVPRINSILVVSSVPELFPKVEELLKKLDSAASENVVKVFVYRVQNGKAEDIVKVLQEIYGESQTQTTTKKSEAPNPAIRPKSQKATTPAAQAPTAAVVKGTETVAGEVTIVFDETNNSILVRATPRDYRSVLATIKSLDVYPRQVLIEVLIAEIRLDDTTSLGFEWAKLNMQGTGSELGVRSGLIAEATSDLRIASGLVYTINYTNSFVSALRALSEENKLDVLASPHIIASNNQEAKIDISREVPIITNETTTVSAVNVGTPTTVDRSIQYRDTGIILTVTPHINDQGLVKLEVNQEVSNVDTTFTVSGINSPVFSKRVATTTLTVQDTQSIIIGGLIRTDKSTTRSGVPVLSRLPVLGWLFGFQSESIQKTELLLMLTPHVIEHIEEADLVTAEFKRKINDVQKEVKTERGILGFSEKN